MNNMNPSDFPNDPNNYTTPNANNPYLNPYLNPFNNFGHLSNPFEINRNMELMHLQKTVELLGSQIKLLDAKLSLLIDSQTTNKNTNKNDNNRCRNNRRNYNNRKNYYNYNTKKSTLRSTANHYKPINNI